MTSRGASAAGLRCLVFTLVILGVSITGCRAPEDPLRVGILAWPPYDLVALALEEELLDRGRYELVTYHTPSELVRSFRYGLLDVMFVTSHFAVASLNEVGDARIFYLIDVSLGGDSLLARPGLDSGEELRGARVGVEVAPLGMYTLIRALDQLGLDRSDVEIVSVDTADQFDAWRNGRVDAVVTYEPTRGRILELGAEELFNSESIPYEILDVVVARAGTIEDHRATLVSFVEGLDRAIDLYRGNPEAAIPKMARRHAISAEAFSRAMSGVEIFDLSANVRLLAGEDRKALEALTRQCEVMFEAGMLASLPEIDTLIDASIVERAAGR